MNEKLNPVSITSHQGQVLAEQTDLKNRIDGLLEQVIQVDDDQQEWEKEVKGIFDELLRKNYELRS